MLCFAVVYLGPVELQKQIATTTGRVGSARVLDTLMSRCLPHCSYFAAAVGFQTARLDVMCWSAVFVRSSGCAAVLSVLARLMCVLVGSMPGSALGFGCRPLLRHGL
jgi:hypothetical protein